MKREHWVEQFVVSRSAPKRAKADDSNIDRYTTRPHLKVNKYGMKTYSNTNESKQLFKGS